MASTDQPMRLEEAFERIDRTILPCISMVLETLLDASAAVTEADPRSLAADLQTLAAQLEELLQAVERSRPIGPSESGYRTAAA